MKKVRIPVIHKSGKVLIPCTLKRAILLVSKGKAKWSYSKTLKIRYLVLLTEITETIEDRITSQTFILGIDPGSWFDGYSVISSKNHNYNCQFTHENNGRRNTKNRVATRNGYRRTRRSRLRHRKWKITEGNCKVGKICHTHHKQLQSRKWLVKEIFKLFPITNIRIERIAFTGTYQNGWTSLHQSQKLFIIYLKSLNLKVSFTKGFITYHRRNSLFGSELKSANKSIKSYYAHCVDSTIIAIGKHKFNLRLLNTKVVYICTNWLIKRELYQHKCYYKDKKYYFRYGKNGKVIYFDKYSKLKKIRVKVNDTNSNHGKIWNYQYTDIDICYKKFNKRYGGTIMNNGASKRKIPSGYNNRYYELRIS